MDIINNENLYDQNLTSFENLLGRLLIEQMIKKAEQHIKEKGFENLFEYITTQLLEYYSKMQGQECSKSSYHYKTKRNGNPKRKIHSSEN